MDVRKKIFVCGSLWKAHLKVIFVVLQTTEDLVTQEYVLTIYLKYGGVLLTIPFLHRQANCHKSSVFSSGMFTFIEKDQSRKINIYLNLILKSTDDARTFVFIIPTRWYT